MFEVGPKVLARIDVLNRYSAERSPLGKTKKDRDRRFPDKSPSGSTRCEASPLTKSRIIYRSPSPKLADFDPARIRSLCTAARSLEDVGAVLGIIHRDMGARTAALVQLGPNRYQSRFELLIDVPQSLSQAIRARRRADDGIMVACERRVLGFAASELERIVEMNDRRRETLAIYDAHGVPEGYTVPLCVSNEPRAYFSFGFVDSERLTIDVMGILTMVAPIVFEAARRVIDHSENLCFQNQLTPRQLDCVSGVARGLTNAQIALELEISVQTVHDHLEAARKRYGAKNTTELMVQALRLGELPWGQTNPLQV